MARVGWSLLAFVVLTVPVFAPVAQPSAGMTYALAPNGDLTPLAGVDPQGGTATLVGEGAEPHILVDRLGRSILIGDQFGVSMSLDGGASWFRNTPLYIAGHDPVFGIGIYDGWAFAQDDAGTIYASTTDGAIINVASSTNGGITWQLAASTLVVDPGLIADRPWMVARGSGQVAMTWNEGGFEQRCSSSTDGGLTWTRTTPFRTTEGLSFPGLSVFFHPPLAATNGLPIGGRPAFDSAGRFVYAGDGGVGGGAQTLFRYPSPLPCALALQTLALPPVGDQLSTPVVADDAGGIYLAAPNADNTAMTLIGYSSFSAASMKRITLSPPALKGNTFGTISIRDNGELAVTWYGTSTAGDFQQGSFSGDWNVFTARVKDFWSATPTVVYQQVTTTPHHVGSICMLGTNCDLFGGDRDLLDYFSTDYDTAGNLHIAYAADGTGGSEDTRVYHAKLTALA